MVTQLVDDACRNKDLQQFLSLFLWWKLGHEYNLCLFIVALVYIWTSSMEKRFQLRLKICKVDIINRAFYCFLLTFAYFF